MNTFKIWIDFDWIFVRDIPSFTMTDEEYLAFIQSAKLLKLSYRLLNLMKNSDWYIITGRKSYLKEITEAQLKAVTPKEVMKNFKWIYFKPLDIPDHIFKYNKCIDLKIELYVESKKVQANIISKFLTCIHYE